MRNFALSISVCLFMGCNKRPDVDSPHQTVSVGECNELSPNDLGIEKRRFTAFPKSDEVAIFRSKKRSQLDPDQSQTYDQIYWTNGEKATSDVVLAPLSFYLGYPEPEANNREQLFRDSWRLRAGGYGYDIKEYTFAGSSWNSSSERATGKIVYTKNNVTKSEDLVFEFEMFVLPISEATKIHPELKKNWESRMDIPTTSWQAAYFLNEKAEQE